MSVSMAEIIDFSAAVAGRTRERLSGLTDDEYFWQPVDGCLTVRRTDDGWTADHPVTPSQVQPFTTLAWRLWHLITCYCSDRIAELLAVDAHGCLTDGDPAPASAADALAGLVRAESWWRDRLATLPADGWADPLGRSAGPYAAVSKAGFVLHMLDEQIHHGAEVALLRDLYARQ